MSKSKIAASANFLCKNGHIGHDFYIACPFVSLVLEMHAKVK